MKRSMFNFTAMALAFFTMLVSGTVYAQEGLILWNKLGSQSEVENSEVGPNGFFDNAEGQLTFEQGSSENGVKYPFYPTDGNNKCKIAFDLSSLNFTTERGTIEFWWKAGFEDNTLLGNNGFRYFFRTADTTVHPPDPTRSSGELSFINDNFSVSRPDIRFFIGQDGGNQRADVGTSSSYHAFNKGDEIHWACVFDINGINNSNKTLMIFKNGEEIASSTKTWDIAPIKSFWLGVLAITYLSRNVRELGYSSAAGVYDELKIWNYAKTNFSTFTRISAGDIVNDGVSSNGCSWGDYDNDRDIDLFVANQVTENNFLYRNDGNGVFSKITNEAIVNDGSFSRSASWGDYDGDGDLDLFVANITGENNFLYQNNGDGTFIQITTGAIVNDGGNSDGCSWGDYDNDGNIDLFVANSSSQNNFLYHNNGDGTFTRITNGAIVSDGGSSRAVNWIDYDNDGDLDLYVTNSFSGNEITFFYKNDGDGTFTKISNSVIVNDNGASSTSSWGDYDNDGDLDLFVGNWFGQNNFLYKNDGDGIFTKITQGDIVNDGGWTHSSSWGDYDNDGDIDLFVANSSTHENQFDNFLYQNNGNGTFTRITAGQIATDTLNSSGCAWGDYDNDGDLDLFIGNHDEGNVLYQNNGNNNHWINILCIGRVSNTSAIGAKVKIKAQINGTPLWQVQEIAGQTGLWSQNSLNAEFGLGDATIIDSIKVEWPSGIVQMLTDVNVDTFLTITEPVKIVTVADTTAAPGDTIRIPLRIDNATGIASAKFEVLFDSAIFEFLDVETAQLTTDFLLVDSIAVDTIKVGLAQATGITNGSGDFVHLVFKVNASAAIDCMTTLTFNQLSLFDEISQKIPVKGHAGIFTVRIDGILGDINADSTVNVPDATLCLRMVAGLSLPPIPPGHIEPTPYEHWAADVDKDGNITTGDALRILYLSLGRSFSKTNPLANTANNEQAVVRVADSEPETFEAGETITIPILVEQRSDVYAADMELSYNTAALTLIEVKAGAARSLLLKNSNESGKLTLAMINTNGLIGSGGKIVTLKFETKQTSASNIPLQVDEVHLFDSQAHPIQVEKGTTSISETTSQPNAFELLQNYPNPFNPETIIQYNLPTSSQVSLKVYNLMGQTVRDLVNAKNAAGVHRVTWDGRNDAGQKVESGIYFYRIEATRQAQGTGGRFVQSMKAVLMK